MAHAAETAVRARGSWTLRKALARTTIFRIWRRWRGWRAFRRRRVAGMGVWQARAARGSGIGLPCGFLRWMRETRPRALSIASFLADR